MAPHFPCDHSRRDLAALVGAGLVSALGGPALAQAERILRTEPLPPEPAPDATELNTTLDAVRRMAGPVMIDGRGPYVFVLDTGANHSVIAAEVAAELGLRSGGQAQIHGIAGAETAETVIVPTMQMGAVSTPRLRMPVAPRDRLGADGLIGIDALKNREVVLNFRDNRLEIGPSIRTRSLRVDTRPPASRIQPTGGIVVTVPARQRSGQLMLIDTDLGGVGVTAFIDSGAQSTVGNMALKDMAIRRGLAPQRQQVVLSSVTGQTVPGELALLPNLRIGGLSTGQLYVAFAPLHTFQLWDLERRPALLIGVDLLRRFDFVSLDFGRREIRFGLPERARAREDGPYAR